MIAQKHTKNTQTTTHQAIEGPLGPPTAWPAPAAEALGAPTAYSPTPLCGPRLHLQGSVSQSKVDSNQMNLP